MLITYLAYIRFVELAFLHEIHGDEAYKVLRTHVWYGEKGSTLHDTDALTDVTEAYTLNYLFVKLGVRDWRQLSSSCARRVLKGVIEVESDLTTTMFEAGFGHTGAVGLSNYGEFHV